MELATYAVVVAYIAGFLALSFRLARSLGRPIWLFDKGSRGQTLPALLFRLSFAGAVTWPLYAAAFGDPISASWQTGFLSGKGPDAIGCVLVLAGACFALFGQSYMGRSWRIGAAEDHVGPIVDSGPFRISRNPVFVGQAVLFVGLSIAMPSLIQALLTAAALSAIALQVRIEEDVLSRALGEPYTAYCERVSRWIGYHSPQRGRLQ